MKYSLPLQEPSTKQRWAEKGKHFSLCWPSHDWWETTSHTKLVSHGQWNPQLTTTKTSTFNHVKYVMYEMEYRTLTFCFMQHRHRGLRVPQKTHRWDRETISFQSAFKWCCGFTGCFLNLPFITLVYPVLIYKTMITYIFHADLPSIHMCVLGSFHFTL